MYHVQSRSEQVNVGMFCRTKITTYCLGFSHSIVIVLTGAALFISLFRYGTGENSFVASSNPLKETGPRTVLSLNISSSPFGTAVSSLDSKPKAWTPQCSIAP